MNKDKVRTNSSLRRPESVPFHMTVVLNSPSNKPHHQTPMERVESEVDIL